MPAKKNTIFGVEAKDVKPDKLPTIGQFVKRTKQDDYDSDGVVEIIWRPGKFRNFTLQTDAFRVIVSDKHPFYGGLSQLFGLDEPTSGCIGIEIVDWQKGSYMLIEPIDAGHWETIGQSGYRWVED